MEIVRMVFTFFIRSGHAKYGDMRTVLGRPDLVSEVRLVFGTLAVEDLVSVLVLGDVNLLRRLAVRLRGGYHLGLDAAGGGGGHPVLLRLPLLLLELLHGGGGLVLDAPLEGGEGLYGQRLDHPLGVEVLGAERGAGELLGGVAGGGAVVGQHLQRAAAVSPVGDRVAAGRRLQT